MATSNVPRHAIQTGTNVSIGNCVASSSAPSQRSCVGESVTTRLPGRARRCLAAAIAVRMCGRASARARSARRGDGRVPVPPASAMPGAVSANGRAARSAASTHAVSARYPRARVRSSRGGLPVRWTGPPPPPPSNCLVCHPHSARDRLPRDTLHRVTRLVGAQAGEIAVIAARQRMLVLPGDTRGQRRRRELRRRKGDAGERKVHVRPAVPEAHRNSRRTA